MAKKRPIDTRQEPGSGVHNRVDRVFVPTRSELSGAHRMPTPPTSPQAPRPQRESASVIANELLASTRAATEAPETELSLRRQLSRLQRQLAESQRELANKDDEVAAEVEKRLQTARELEESLEMRRNMQERVDELLAYHARTAGIEARLQETIAAADELGQVNERERAATVAATARVEELNRAFEETRQLWNAERAMIEERNANEIAQLDAKRKAAVDASADALNAQAARLREAHEAQLAELRATHEQSLAALRTASEQSLSSLRADLAPKALQAHNLAEERERLIAELATVRNEAIRETVEREETYKREQAAAAEAAQTELATVARQHKADIDRLTAERDQQLAAAQQALKSAEARADAAEDQLDSLRLTIKSIQREAAEAKERVAALESDKKSTEDALERSRALIEALTDDKRVLQEAADAIANEARRNALDRHRFVAYLEEGLALLGALPPRDEPKDELEDESKDASSNDEPDTTSS